MSKLQLKSGFTLIEMLIVLAIVGLLAGAVSFSTVQSGQQSRDAKRQADLRNLQTAIETYKARVGRYPMGCNPVGQWSGQLGGAFSCNTAPYNGTGQYIVGLAPDYIAILPTDPKLNGLNSGYVYRTNVEGTVYKIMAMSTVEADTLTTSHTFKSCDVNGRSGNDINIAGWCKWRHISAGDFEFPSQCNFNQPTSRFYTSYGLWGGVAPLVSSEVINQFAENLLVDTNLIQTTPAPNDNRRARAVKNTVDVICM